MLGIISLSVCQEKDILAMPRFISTIEIHYFISKDNLKTITLYVTVKYLLKAHEYNNTMSTSCGFQFEFYLLTGLLLHVCAIQLMT